MIHGTCCHDIIIKKKVYLIKDFHKKTQISIIQMCSVIQCFKSLWDSKMK